MAAAHRRPRRVRARDALSWGVMLVLALGWWLTLAPASLGGPALFVSVHGSSMEPLLHTGDLVITHRQSSYKVGDLVVVGVDGGKVIHRITAGSAATGWTTQGDNRETPDAWVIPDDAVLGRAWVTVPAFDDRTAPFRSRWAQPTLVGLVTLILLLPRRRRRSLRAVAVAAVGEPLRRARPSFSDQAGLVTALGCATVGAYSAWLHLGDGRGLVVPALSLAVASTVSTALGLRVFLGVGVAEPRRTLTQLRAGVFALDPRDARLLLHPTAMVTRVTSVRELRRRAASSPGCFVYVLDARRHRFLFMTDSDVAEYSVPRAESVAALEVVAPARSDLVLVPRPRAARVLELPARCFEVGSTGVAQVVPARRPSPDAVLPAAT